MAHLKSNSPSNSVPVLGYILKGYPRISETFISNEILLLEKLGFSMHLFPMRLPRENFTHDSVKQINARVDYLPTELVPEFFRLLIPNIFLAAKVPAQYKLALSTARRGLSRGRELLTLKHLLQGGFMANNHLLPSNRIVHLHGHFAHSPTSVTRFGAIFSGLPFSFTAHAKDIYTSNKEKLRTKIEHADFVVTCTKHNKAYLEEVAASSKTPIYCVYHGIDLSLFNNSLNRERKKSTPAKLLTVARMTEKKGLPTVYKALALVKEKGIDFTHTLIGDGDDREKIVNLRSSLNLEDHCHMLGTQTHEQVLRQFKNSDLFILGCEIAGNGDRDGIPNVLVESLAMGVPALSTKVSAIPEILINERTGITVDPGDPEKLAEAIQRILSDQKLRNHLIHEGKNLVREKFDNTMWIKKLSAIFHQHNPEFQKTLSTVS